MSQSLKVSTRHDIFLLHFPTNRRIQSNILMPFQFLFNANQLIILNFKWDCHQILIIKDVFYDHFPYSLEFNHLLYDKQKQYYTINYPIHPPPFIISIYFGLTESFSFIQCFRIDWKMSLILKIYPLMVQSSNSFRCSRFEMCNLNIIWCWIDQQAVSVAF